MRPSLAAALAVAGVLAATGGCLRSRTDRIGSRTYEIRGEEAGIADAFERTEPLSTPEERCVYWRVREDEVYHRRAVKAFGAVTVGHLDYSPALRDWVTARRRASCLPLDPSSI